MRRCRYGQHLSKEQVAELVAPHPDTLELVSAWLKDHEIPSSAGSITHDGGWLTIKKLPLTQANALLSADYRIYQHTETDETIIRTTGYALPASMHEHVQTVAPTTYFGPSRQSRVARLNSQVVPNEIPSSCSNIITPKCLRMLYKTVNYTL